jgi:hypothetical protein
MTAAAPTRPTRSADDGASFASSLGDRHDLSVIGPGVGVAVTGGGRVGTGGCRDGWVVASGQVVGVTSGVARQDRWLS